MPRGRPRKEISEIEEAVIEPSTIEQSKNSDVVIPTETELQYLQTLCAELKSLGVNSISDLEVKIARLQK